MKKILENIEKRLPIALAIGMCLESRSGEVDYQFYIVCFLYLIAYKLYMKY